MTDVFEKTVLVPSTEYSVSIIYSRAFNEARGNAQSMIWKNVQTLAMFFHLVSSSHIVQINDI